MSGSQYPSFSHDIDISPTSNLAIYLYLSEDARAPTSATSSRPKLGANNTRTMSAPAKQSKVHPLAGQLTLARVLDMRLEDLDALQTRVAQMEVSNREVLTRIYGRFPTNHQAFSMLFNSASSRSDLPEFGSSEHRQLLFTQYRKMLAIARDPPRSVDIVEPATSRGAKALQDYQMQLTILAEQRQAQMKRKHNDEADAPARPPPRFDPGVFKAMRDQCRVIDFEPKVHAPINHRNDRVIDNNQALTAYQQQLVLLEEQNQKRLLMAREQQGHVKHEQISRRHVKGEADQETSIGVVKADQSSFPFRNRRQTDEEKYQWY